MQKSSVLLTGGLGFIGSHTAVELMQRGNEVIIVDDLSNSTRDVADRIQKITGTNPTLYIADVSNRAEMDRIFSENDIASVIHFAGYKAVGESVSEPLKYYKNNLATTITLMETMIDHNVNSLVFSSSATVYGSSGDVPFRESHERRKCSNPYGWTKNIIEQIIEDVSVANPEMSFVILRYFNPIGAHKSGLIGEKPKGIPNNLMPYITQVASGTRDELKVYGNDYPTSDGTGVRDYIHVVDLAKGHIAAIDYAVKNSGVEIFNLGTGKGTSVLELIKTFERVNGVRVPYSITDRRSGDVAVCYADVSKAEKVLGWKAQYDIEDMCRDSWRWENSLIYK